MLTTPVTRISRMPAPPAWGSTPTGAAGMYVYLREVSVRVFPAPPVVYLTLTVTVPGRCAGVVTLTLLPSPRIRFVPGLVSNVTPVITGCRLNDTGEGT